MKRFKAKHEGELTINKCEAAFVTQTAPSSYLDAVGRQAWPEGGVIA